MQLIPAQWAHLTPYLNSRIQLVGFFFICEISQREANANMLGVWWWTTPITISINLNLGHKTWRRFQPALPSWHHSVQGVLQGVTDDEGEWLALTELFFCLVKLMNWAAHAVTL